MLNVVVTDLEHITIDGVSVGSVIDAIENYRGVDGIRGAILKALQDWHAGVRASHVAAIQSQHDRLAAEHSAALLAVGERHTVELQTERRVVAESRVKFVAEHEAAVVVAAEVHAKDLAVLKEKHEAELAEVKKEADEHATIIHAMGGLTLGQQKAREARRAELAQTIADNQAEFARLSDS